VAPAVIRALLVIALVLAGCGEADPAPRVGCPTTTPPGVPVGFRATLLLETGLGEIRIALDDRSPSATGSLVALVRCGAYDGTVFHRVVPGFVVQGGDIRYGRDPIDIALVGAGGPPYTVADDPVVPTYRRGTVGLARGGAANSGGSQFYIALDDASARDSLAAAGDTAILGEVVSGMAVVDAIAAGPQDGSLRNLALDPVVITRATLLP
jgi:cyclophilin family peptidyl-prolyl cis-trans isomerase